MVTVVVMVISGDDHKWWLVNVDDNGVVIMVENGDSLYIMMGGARAVRIN